MSELVLAIEGKVFLVTGGAAGIGAAICRILLHENAAHVIFLDIAEREGKTLEAELKSTFGALRVKFIKCDVAKEAELTDAYRQVMDKYRRLDVVVNSAAVISAEESSYSRTIGVNFEAVVSSTFKALDIMRVDKGGSGGAVLNISSLVALNLTCHLPVYAATKAAVLLFSKSIGMEMETCGVRVLTACLGPTDTALLHRRNFENFDKDCEPALTPNRQRVVSAANGIVEVIKFGQNGSVWKIANDRSPEDITEHVKSGYDILGNH